MNTIGNIYRLTSFGESHGAAIGGVLDGVPAGLELDLEAVQAELDRRRPGQSAITTARSESDRVEFLSGLLNGVTTGTPIGFVVRNENYNSDDYTAMAAAFRPSHADYTYMAKYGLRDARGGGRASARATIARVVAGAVARQFLASIGIDIYAYTSQVGDIRLPLPYYAYDKAAIERNAVRCPDAAIAEQMEQLIMRVKAEGDTLGGVITGVIKGVKPGVGEPEGGKLHAMLGAAMLSINAAKGFDYGLGFDFADKRGSAVADRFVSTEGRITTATNNSGGIQGGIANGEDIYFRVAFKPVATLMRPMPTVDTEGRDTVIEGKGRHDPCVVPRAVPIVEAMAAITLLDAVLMARASRWQ